MQDQLQHLFYIIGLFRKHLVGLNPNNPNNPNHSKRGTVS